MAFARNHSSPVYRPPFGTGLLATGHSADGERARDRDQARPREVALDAHQQVAALPQERRADEPRVGLVERRRRARKITIRCGCPVRSSAGPPSISSGVALVAAAIVLPRIVLSIVPRTTLTRTRLRTPMRCATVRGSYRNVTSTPDCSCSSKIPSGVPRTARCTHVRPEVPARLRQRDPRAELQARARRAPTSGQPRDGRDARRCAGRTSRARGRAGRPRPPAPWPGRAGRARTRAARRAAAAGAARCACGRAAMHARRERGRLREAVGEGAQVALERHASTSRLARSRSSARAVRDLTVPRATPSTAAVSSSPRSSTKRQAITLRSRSGSAASASRRRPSLERRRVRRGRLPGQLVGGALRQAVATPAVAHAVARLVGDDREQPGAKLGAPAKPPQRQPGAHERLLGGLLGIGRGAGDEIGRAERDRLVLLDEGFVGARVATPRAHGAVIRRLGPAVHALLLHLGARAAFPRARIRRRNAQHAREPARQVPVPFAHQLHERGHEQDADDRRVDEDRRRPARSRTARARSGCRA